MGLSLVIPTWNGLEYLAKLLASLQEVEFSDDDEIIVADGNSSDGTPDFVRAVASSSSVTVKLVPLYDNFGFAGNTNAGLKEARPENDVVILNNDCLITNPDTFALLADAAYADPKLGVVSPIQLGVDGRIQAHGAGHLPFSQRGMTWSAGELPVGQYPGLRECEVVPFVCAFIKRDCLRAVGLLDEDFFAYFEDSDFCLRARRAGWKVGSLGSVTVLHAGPGSTAYRVAPRGKLYQESHEIFKKKWGPILDERFSQEVVWVGTSGIHTGYGFWSRHAQRAALDAGVRTFYQPGRVSPELDPPTGDPFLDDCRGHMGSPQMPQILIEHASRFPRASGRWKIGWTMSDVDHWPKEWIDGCAWVDEIWVPTEIDRQRLRGHGVTKPITVMPLGVDPGYFHPGILPWPHRPEVDFLFVSNFQWGIRKNPDLLITAFRDEFGKEENVALFIKTTPWVPEERIPFETRWWLREPAAPVVIYQYPVPDFALGQFYTQADCFVLPTSGEGWCLPAMEALACGIPVIITGWSAPVEWGMDERGQPLPGMHFIDYRYVECRSDMTLYRDSCWAMPDYHDLRRLMREAFTHRAEWRAAAQEGSRIIRTKFTWQALGERIRERLAALG